jgi:FtsP/CotA-like multicopper oxidase with cupredoxin domain
MRPMNMQNPTSKTQLLLALTVAVALLFTPAAFAAAPGITSTAGTAGTFNLTAQDGSLNQPDGEAVYSWGYGCVAGSATFVPATITGAFCNTMQVPGPTVVVTEGMTVTINLTNNLPTAAGNTSILFPGFQLTSTCANSATNPQGLLACEAAPGATVTYTFVASAPGTHPYYSGTQGDLQIEMGMYGAVIVLPSSVPAACTAGLPLTNPGANATAKAFWGEPDFRLAAAAYDHPRSCYDREYLFQWAEMDSRIHREAQAQVTAKAGCTAGMPGCSLDVHTEPYHPAYFLINGRSMPDLMDPNYASEYPHQPYNGNPHIHPGELMLIRTIGQGRWQHPYHEHANHVRILARDGNLILSPTNPTTSLAGQLMFNTDTTPGESFDGIFYFTGRGLNWDPYGHHPASTTPTSSTLTIAGLSESGTTVTVTVANTVPAYLLGKTVSIAGASNVSGSTTTPIAGYNGSFTITAVNPPYTFTYTAAASGLSAGNSGAATVNVNVTGANNTFPTDPLASLPCTPDVNGYNTGAPTAVNYFEWCQDHNKPVEVNPFGDVASGGPATLPDPDVFTNGAWYGGTPYLGPDASLRAQMPACTSTAGTGVATPATNCTTLNPVNTQANPANERGWAFMWHSHNEREITTNNVFPGGMLMMLLVDSREFVIDESQ